MRKAILLSLYLMLFSSSSLASGAGVEVLFTKGVVHYNGQTLRKDISIPLGHELSTGKNSFVKIKIPKIGRFSGLSVVLGPNSKIFLSAKPLKKERHRFIKGAARFIHDEVQGEDVQIHTPQVSIAVRGTEYLLKVNEALGESEIVLFEGAVKMSNLKQANDSIDIKPGQWGGLGGRFGSEIAPAITLPVKVFSGFKKLLNI